MTKNKICSGFLFSGLPSTHRKLIENTSKTQRKLDTEKYFYAVIRLAKQPIRAIIDEDEGENTWKKNF